MQHRCERRACDRNLISNYFACTSGDADPPGGEPDEVKASNEGRDRFSRGAWRSSERERAKEQEGDSRLRLERCASKSLSASMYAGRCGLSHATCRPSRGVSLHCVVGYRFRGDACSTQGYVPREEPRVSLEVPSSGWLDRGLCMTIRHVPRCVF